MAYNSKQNNSNDVLNVLVRGIKSIVRRRRTDWVGTMTQLGETIQNRVSTVPQNWPASPSALRTVLNRAVRKLRSEGVKVRFSRTTDHMRTRLVNLASR
jgi:hypothetical protein